MILRIFPALLIWLAGMASGMAAPITREGVTFTEASDNVRLVELSGTGTLADPFILVEEITGDGDAIVAVDIHSLEFGSRVETVHRVGFALIKVVINRTAESWRFFSIELERDLGSGSDYYDGLSFGQDTDVNRPFVSDRFGEVDDIIEPRDVVRFRDGAVRPGERVSFRFAVTHTGLTPKFFLVQHQRRPVSDNAVPFRFAGRGDGLTSKRR